MLTSAIFGGCPNKMHMGRDVMKALTLATLLALTIAPSYGFAQAPQKLSDEELSKLALSAAPDAISKDAAVMAVDPDGKMRTLRKGTGQWTCMPGHADPSTGQSGPGVPRRGRPPPRFARRTHPRVLEECGVINDGFLCPSPLRREPRCWRPTS